MADGPTRTERDSMGEIEVPAEAYYGASTQRAALNFPISSLRFGRPFIRALGLIKFAAARVNAELGLLEPRIAEAIQDAAREVADGKLDDQFVVDIFQTGSGTSTNMNANEVIANRAGEILGGKPGSKLVHPNDHVNLGQSSNDVIPTAIHIAALVEIEQRLIPALGRLAGLARGEGRRSSGPIVKTGRTHLQDATPIRLGQEFRGYAGQVERGIRRLRRAQEELAEVALGGTAVGTGINTHPEFASRVCAVLSSELGVSVRETENHFQAQSTLDGVARSQRLAAHRRCQPPEDRQRHPLARLRPARGPRRARAPRSAARQLDHARQGEPGHRRVAHPGGRTGHWQRRRRLPGGAGQLLRAEHDAAGRGVQSPPVDRAAGGGQRQLRRAAASRACSATERGPEMVERGLMLATALAPAIGYDAAAEIAKEAAKSGRTIREVAREKTQLSEEELDRLLDPEKMTEPGLGAGPAPS